MLSEICIAAIPSPTIQSKAPCDSFLGEGKGLINNADMGYDVDRFLIMANLPQLKRDVIKLTIFALLLCNLNHGRQSFRYS
ncbi:hypothetical protein SAMN05428947_10360 [Mucilaginibacter sp. OK283]|jgi:hypothetical protein|nr:hypothetical protein SAMN05428947_10360 [Mucilaginibacter sp. OK283]